MGGFGDRLGGFRFFLAICLVPVGLFFGRKGRLKP
jgi:hypothetical protein